MPCNDVFAEKAPTSHSCFGVFACDGQEWFSCLLSSNVNNDIKDDDSCKMSHALFSDAQQLLSIFGELDPLDCGRKFPSLQTFASAYFPKLDSIVGGSGSK